MALVEWRSFVAESGMLERCTGTQGVVFYRSTELSKRGIPHAFSTRIGGVSAGPFAALNLGNPAEAAQQDALEHVEQNYERLQAALGVGGRPRAWVKQVHSSRVELVEQEGEGEYSETPDALVADHFHGQRQADGLVTELAGVLLTVRIADCAPVLLAAGDGRCVAAVHAGWRGAISGVLPRAVRAMGELGVLPREVVAAVGPCLGVAHFEVGPEVADFFDIAHLSTAVERQKWVKPHVNLPVALRLQLEQAGVRQIDLATDESLCTFANALDFFSHRRDHGVTGRQAAVISRP